MTAPHQAPSAEAGGAFDWEDPSTLPLDQVRELFVTLAKALRAYQLYDENNPVYKRFVGSLHAAFKQLWDEGVERLPVQIEEDRITWVREEVYRSESRSDSLSWLFFKDGVREVTFLPGVEDEELESLLSVLQRARNLSPESDDLLTILWEAELVYFQYHYVDVLAEVIDGPLLEEHEQPDLTIILRGELNADDIPDPSAQQAIAEGEEPPPQTQISADDFNPTLYSFDQTEMEQLRRAVAAEEARDLRGDVLAALFDRLEEPENAERQSEILNTLRTLLPNFLSHGEIASAADVLRELSSLLTTDRVLDDTRRRDAAAILDELSQKESIEELIRALQDGSIRPGPRELGDFLRHLGPGALEPLVRAAEETDEKELRPVLREAVRGIAQQNHKAIHTLLDSSDPVVVAGIARLAGRIQLVDAGPKLASLLDHEDERVQLAAIEAAVHLRASTAASALETALDHDDREIRIAAAKGLGELRYKPGANALKAALTGKRIKHADLSEKIAFFEAYGLLAGENGVAFLDRTLNARGFLGKREPPDIRACAALALGKIKTAPSRRALLAAESEDDPVIRSAVNRALRGEE